MKPETSQWLPSLTWMQDMGHRMSRRHHYKSLPAFKDKASKVHGDKYDYSLIEFPIKAHDTISIICGTHGLYTQKAYSHIAGNGCNKCKKTSSNKMSFDDFVHSCIQKFSNKFSEYKTTDNFSLSHSIISFACPIHGRQEMKALLHRNSVKGCPACYSEHRSDRQLIGHHKYLEKANKIHANKYEYPFIETEFKNSASEIIVRCKIHGDFKTNARQHLRASNCPICANLSRASATRKQVKDIITEASKIHNNFYDYSLVTQVKNNKHKIQIICPIHGIFSQSVNNHLRGQNCPKCALEKNNPVSSQEIILRDWLSLSLSIKCYHSYRPDFLSGQELDLFLPDYNLAIEINGAYWHSLKDENYHINKLNRCEANGIRLLQLYDTEINTNLDWVKSIILKVVCKNQLYIPIGILDRRLYSILDCVNYELIDPEQEPIDKYLVWNSGYINNKGEF